MQDVLLTSAFVILVTAAAVLDVRTRRIPNVLTVSGLMIALVLRSTLGADALIDGLQSAGTALLVVLPLFLIGALGGGDLKLLVAVGAFMEPGQFFHALLVTAIAGGVLAVAASIRKGVILPVLYNTGSLARYSLSGGRAGSRSAIGAPGAVTVPYGLAIAVGSLAAWFL